MVYRTTLDDPGRLAALERTEALDNVGDAPFERLVDLARQLTQSDVALICMVGADRQTFVGQAGLPEPLATSRTTPLSHSFCQHVVRRADSLIVRDARQDPIVRDNPAVAEHNAIAYVGVPLVTPDGYVIGSLCAIDGKPRDWTDDEANGLRNLASQVLTEIALRSELKSRRAAEHSRDILFGELNHRVRNLFTLVLGLVRAVDADDPSVLGFQNELATRIKALCLAHDLVFEGSRMLSASTETSALACRAPSFSVPSKTRSWARQSAL
ncbi:MAG: GAF domain-containing protein, partial [Pseudomonadota bacterium]